MEMLKLFATYETTLSLAEQAKWLRERDWPIDANGDGLVCNTDNLRLQLEPSGDPVFLLRGEVAQHPSGETDALLTFLHACAELFQLDIFEEDGRLIRRLSSSG